MRPLSMVRGLISGCQKFWNDTKGSVAIVFTFSLPVIVFAVGTAANYSRGSNALVHMQGALDTAVLAAANELSSGSITPREIEAYGREVFLANIEDDDDMFSETPTVTFDVNQDEGVVTGQANGEVPFIFNLLNELSASQINAGSQAGFGVLDVELAMALDLTGSMRGQKIADLKTAAISAVDQLIDTNNTSFGGKVRIALAPYSAGVDIGSYATEVTGLERKDRLNDCMPDRSSTSDDAPGLRDPFDQDPRAVCPGSELVALTDNAAKLRNEINGFDVGGCTAGHIGIAYAYYTLSPRWNAVFTGESKAKPYDEKNNRKVALIMTDGSFNTAFEGVGGRGLCTSEGVSKSRSRALGLCRSMRDDGILVYSVAFKAPSDAESLLRDCAGETSRYFETNTGNELIAAFEDIANEVKDLRLTR